MKRGIDFAVIRCQKYCKTKQKPKSREKGSTIRGVHRPEFRVYFCNHLLDTDLAQGSMLTSALWVTGSPGASVR